MKQETVQDYFNLEKMCEQIIKLDHTIRLVTIINYNGKFITSKLRKEVNLFVSNKDKEMLLTEVALRTRMRHEFDNELGSVNFSLSHRKKVIIMSFPFRNRIVYLSADLGFEFTKTPFHILDILKQTGKLS